MAHAIIVTCDACGHEERYGDPYTPQSATEDLITRWQWQSISYVEAGPIKLDHVTTTEIRCPACRLTPIAERKEDHETAAD